MSVEPLCLSCAQVQYVDRFAMERLGIPGSVLMENAGRGCVDLLVKQEVEGAVLVLCGPGNNGGDGWVIARHLQVRGVNVKVGLVCDAGKYRGDAAIHWRIAQALGIPTVQFSPDSTEEQISQLISALFQGERLRWVVDAMLGTGAKGPPRQHMLPVIEAVNRAEWRCLAVDLPSGLDADRGVISTTLVRADMTATFVAAKPGLLTEDAARWVGKTCVLDIGIPDHAIRAAIRDMPTQR